MRYDLGMAIKLSTDEREVLECIRTLSAENGNKGEVSEWDVVGHFRGQKTSIRVLNLMDSVWQKGHTLKKYPNRIVPIERLTPIDRVKPTVAETKAKFKEKAGGA